MLKRYFIELAFDGSGYSGWQKQKNSITIQEELENAIQTILESKIDLVGCGRTDAGVHASQYFAHFDYIQLNPEQLVFKLNRYLSSQFRIFRIYEVENDFHARYNALSRSYEYRINTAKSPFKRNFSYYFPQANKLDLKELQNAATLLMNYNDFYPFCKTRTDVQTTLCVIMQSKWTIDLENEVMVYRISANRFLRGMVRLIVGMCLNVALNKVLLQDVITGLESHSRLIRDWSVPAHGLFLSAIKYDNDVIKKKQPQR